MMEKDYMTGTKKLNFEKKGRKREREDVYSIPRSPVNFPYLSSML